MKHSITCKQLKTDEEIKELIEWHNQNSKVVVLDTETTGLDAFTDRITDVVISGRQPSEIAYFAGSQLALLQGLRVETLVLQHFKFDFHIAYRSGVDLRNCGTVRDTSLLHHLIDENSPHDLDTLVQLKYNDDYKAVFWAKYKTFEEAPREEQELYMCKDVYYTGLLYVEFLADLTTAGVPDSLITHVHKLARRLYDSELEGLRVDLDYLTAIGVELKPLIYQFRTEMRNTVPGYVAAIELDEYTAEVDKRKTIAGKQRVKRPTFNWDSSRQLCTLLYSKLKLPAVHNKAKNLSVDDKALERNAHLHPIVPMIQEYRGYQKVYTAFIEGTLERLNNGRIYPSFNVNGTTTGRISSSNPNLQQLPSKGAWAKVRGIYTPTPDHRILTCDYGQLEVVVAAHFSQDKNLLKIINEGISKHDITAQSLGIPRDLAKTLNFAMQYLCSTHKVRELMNCSKEDAEFIWNKYWETYSGEKRVIDECKARIDAGLPIVTLFGRQRHFPTEYEKFWHKEKAYRQAYSSLIQGTGADLTHWAFYTVADDLEERGLGRALFEVHDEILIEAKVQACTEAAEVLKSRMIESGVRVNLSLPLTVDCSEPLDRWIK